MERLVAEIEEELMEEEDNPEEEIDEAKEEERRKKAVALWQAVQSGEVKNVSQKVASILNRFDETRNSDVALMLRYWEIFEGHSGSSVTHKKLFEYERLTTIARARAKIQNEFKLFLPTDNKIRQKRRDLAKIESEFQIATKPELPSISIYADETGKTDDYLIVGGFWILDPGREGKLKVHLMDWLHEAKEKYSTLPKEFHFTKLKNDGSDIEVYKAFFDKIIGSGDMISFKAIGVNKRKLGRDLQKGLLEELFYQLLRMGINHEVETGRISFPKQISYIKDKEGNESRFHIEQISQKISDSLKANYEDNLKLNSYVPMESELERFLQVADLFSASINRIYNYQPKNPNRNAKDILAEYILQLLDLQVHQFDAEDFKEINEIQSESDMAVLYLFD